MAVDRLFAPDRDQSERVRDDDWFPSDGELREKAKALNAGDSVGLRRRWYVALRDLGVAVP